MKAPLLEVRDLQVSYGAVHALKGISLEVHEGEIVSLIGANGAGKSTTLRAISGLQPFLGSVFFAGQELQGKPAHRIVGLGLAHSPEGRGIFAEMSVLENIELGAHSRRDGRKAIQADLDKSLDLFPRLRERREQKAGTMSGGEQQMLAMARALMSRPQLLMLDEPSLGLAPLIVAQIFKVIEQLHREGVAILLVEQNARMALRAAGRAYVLETGLISFSGAGSELLHDPRVIEAYLGG